MRSDVIPEISPIIPFFYPVTPWRLFVFHADRQIFNLIQLVIHDGLIPDRRAAFLEKISISPEKKIVGGRSQRGKIDRPQGADQAAEDGFSRR